MVSDSTYVVNCFRDRWWQGWLERGWTNSAKKPVANRDLWEPLIGLYVDRGDVAFDWVKGHSGDRMNDLVDALAVAACRGSAGLDGPDRDHRDSEHVAESLDRSKESRTMEGQGNTPHPKEHPMTTIKRLLRRLDGYTLEAFNAPATHGRSRGRHSAR